jgi:hypothetical protein
MIIEWIIEFGILRRNTYIENENLSCLGNYRSIVGCLAGKPGTH